MKDFVIKCINEAIDLMHVGYGALDAAQEVQHRYNLTDSQTDGLAVQAKKEFYDEIR
jgi:hypothetical protein